MNELSVFGREDEVVAGCLVGGIEEPRWRKRKKIKEKKFVKAGKETCMKRKERRKGREKEIEGKVSLHVITQDWLRWWCGEME